MFQAQKQKLLFEYLISSPDTFTLCHPILKAKYFDPEFRKAMDFALNYYGQYRAIATPEQIAAESGLTLEYRTVSRDDLEYCRNEIEKFCRRKALEAAIVASPELLESDEGAKFEQMVKDALSVSLTKDLGLDYFADPLSRLEKMAEKPLRTSTGWRSMDELLGGGLARTEMILFCANSGGGKSVTLGNLALNFLKQGLNVLYLSLELSEEMISQRFDMMLSGISPVAVQSRYKEIAHAVLKASKGMGSFKIKRMQSGTNANQIRGYIKECETKEGFVPDLLIVDYLDIMGPNEHVSADNVSEKDKRVAEQLRDIGFTYNMYIASASQLNRSAIDAEQLNQSHTAGGLTKVNTVDWQVAIVHNSAMKAMGEILYTFLKARSSDAVGKTVYMKWDGSSLLVTDKDRPKDGDGIKSAVQNSTLTGIPEKTDKSFLDI